jgi:predicted HicB family RNase H-like nuclease
VSTKKAKVKMGRPPKAKKDKLNWTVSVRLSQAQYARLSGLAREAGLSLSQYVVKKLDL